MQAPHEAAERLVEIDAQRNRQRVHAIADETIAAGGGLAGERYSDREIALAGEALAQDGECRQKRGIQRGRAALRQRPDRRRQRGRKIMEHRARLEIRLHGARMIGRQ